MATPPIVDVEVRNDYTSGAGQTTFTYTFWAKAETDIDVYVNDVLKTLTTDYTISAVQNASGADVVFTSGLNNGDLVAIVYSPDIERQTNFETSGQFTADAVNLEFDTHTSYIQYINTTLGRTLRVSDSESTSASLTVEAPDSNANKFLKVNASGTGYDYATVAASDTLANYETQLFSGTGVLDTFTLTAFTPLDSDQIEVVVDNQTQYPVSDYNISGNDVVFESGSIPASGTNNIFVRNLANGSLTTTPADNSVSTAKLQNNAVTAAKIDADFIVDYTDTVITATDLILFGDVSDTNNSKRDTVQGIIDLVPTDLFGKSDTTITATDKISFADVSDSDNPKTDTVQGILDLVGAVFTESYTSADQTITSGGSLTLAHGLSGQPKLIQLYLEAQSSTLGYSADDQVLIHAGGQEAGSNRGIALWPDATNINIRFGSSASMCDVVRADTGATAAITNGSWRLIVKAWA